MRNLDEMGPIALLHASMGLEFDRVHKKLDLIIAALGGSNENAEAHQRYMLEHHPSEDKGGPLEGINK